MARPRSFDESELLEAVMVAFWHHGYTATTYRSLEAMSGVGIRSLANTFGEKDELFSKALARYRGMVAGNLATMFDPPSVDAIVAVFERVSSPAENQDPRMGGCLMVNTVFEIDDPAQEIATEIAQYRDLFRSMFQQALEAHSISDAETRAEFLVGALWGALSQIRLAGNTAAAKPMSAIVVETIRGWIPSD
ncbi:MAG: TetR/AcrR family transcriptional repressor of nem operon [Acidimicrobiales bacterium]|jgi:TetR/AcrR family transcriptional repressor of nem operon